MIQLIIAAFAKVITNSIEVILEDKFSDRVTCYKYY